MDELVSKADELPEEAASGLSDGLGASILLDLRRVTFYDPETNANTISIIITFAPRNEIKFGVETIEAPCDAIEEVYMELKNGMDMRDVCMGLARLTGFLATKIGSFTTSA